MALPGTVSPVAAPSEPAESSRTFAQPPLVRRLAIWSVVLCAAACVFLVSIPVLHPERVDWPLLLSCLLVFGVSFYLSVAFVRRSWDTFVVADDGLWWHSPGRPSLRIGWDEIARVEPQNVMQRLLVTDSTGERRMWLEYHLQNFGELRRLVLERARNRRR